MILSVNEIKDGEESSKMVIIECPRDLKWGTGRLY